MSLFQLTVDMHDLSYWSGAEWFRKMQPRQKMLVRWSEYIYCFHICKCPLFRFYYLLSTVFFQFVCQLNYVLDSSKSGDEVIVKDEKVILNRSDFWKWNRL